MPRLTPGQMVPLPWRWQGPVEHRDEHGNQWWEIRIEELDEFFVAASTPEEVLAEAAPALEAFLESYLSRAEVPPLPALFGGRPEIPEAYARVREPQVA